MKKLFVFLSVVAVFAACTVGKPLMNSRYITATYSPGTYAVTSADTVYINKSNAIAGVTIDVPASATDSVYVKGKLGTISGLTSGYVKIPPSNVRSIGYNDGIRLDSVTIIVKSKAYLYLTPAR